MNYSLIAFVSSSFLSKFKKSHDFMSPPPLKSFISVCLQPTCLSKVSFFQFSPSYQCICPDITFKISKTYSVSPNNSLFLWYDFPLVRPETLKVKFDFFHLLLTVSPNNSSDCILKIFLLFLLSSSYFNLCTYPKISLFQIIQYIPRYGFESSPLSMFFGY